MRTIRAYRDTFRGRPDELSLRAGRARVTTARTAATVRAVAAAASETRLEQDQVKRTRHSGFVTGNSTVTPEACRVRWYLLRGSVTYAAVR